MEKAPETTSVDVSDGDARAAAAAPVVAAAPQRSWRGYLWDTLDKAPEERRFLAKLDAGLLSICCLGYFIKFLDQSNITNAFVSGMREDLDMYGNQLNYVTTLWTVGYILGQIPGNVILTRVRPSVWLPCNEILWSILTMCIARCHNVTQLYVLRFFIGLLESTYYPGMVYLIGSWYRRDELGKRVVIFNISGALATMFSGYLMTAVINLDGRNGIQGWQWLFIMDGVISLPIALSGFFVIPDFPHNTRAFYINQRDVAVATKRMELEHREAPKAYTTAKVVKIFTSWHIYLLPLAALLAGGLGAVGQAAFTFYLKYHKNPTYTIAQINDYPTAASAVQVVTSLAYAWISDSVLRGARWPVLVWITLVNIVLFSSLLVWDIAEGWRWTCYMLYGQGIAIGPLTLVWANEVCSDDNEERAVVVGWTNDIIYVFGAWLPILIWPQVDAPRYHTGYIAAVVAAALGIFLILAVQVLWQRELARKRRAEPEAEPIEA